MAKDMHSHLRQMAERFPEQVVTVSEIVDSNLEATALLQRLENENRFPTVIFRNVKCPGSGKVSEFPLVFNMFARRSYLAVALDMAPEKFREELTLEGLRRAGNRIAPVVVAREEAPVKQVVKTGPEVDLFDLPIAVHHPRDVKPFILGGAVVQKDPELNTYNVALTRIQLNEPRQTGIKVEVVHHNGAIHAKNEEQGRPTPAAVVIGHHPAFYLGGQWEGHGSINGLDEYEIIGGMLDEPLRLVPSETFGHNLLVPADAEIIIEGNILPGVRQAEGPIAEHTRYYKNILGKEIVPHEAPVFEVTAMTCRTEAFYLDTFIGHPDEQMLCAIPKEAKIRQAVLLPAPGVKAVHLPPSGCGRYIGYMSIRANVEGAVRNAILAAFGCDPHLKYVIAVDEDIDVFQEDQVLWALALRTIPSNDCFVIPGARSIWLDPMTPMDGRRPVSAKMGIDATKPFGKPFSATAYFSPDLVERMDPAKYLDAKADLKKIL
ncbi:MAG: UbiD family decarboxylase [Desulfobacterales bacterium]|nr:UbiD family decarboxylase [Desulfobacterales bacterium]